MEKKKYYLVSAEALPEVFIKVAEAKRMLQVGEADTVGEAARLVGISRSAFYKYKDAGANILTINQTIPTNGCAGVTISAETSEMVDGLEELMSRAAAAQGVLKFEILAG